MKNYLAVVVLLAGIAFAAPASAALVTFNYTAEGNGGSVVGTFSWDTDAPEVWPDISNVASYRTGAITGTIIGGAQDGGFFNIANPLWEVLDFHFTAPYLDVLSGGFPGVSISLWGDASALNSSALPTDLTLSDFNIQALLSVSNSAAGLGDGNSGVGDFSYNLTSLSLQPPAEVPLPAAAPLFLVGVAFSGWLSRKPGESGRSRLIRI